MLSSHSVVSSSRTVRPCSPQGGQWIGHWRRTWSTVGRQPHTATHRTFSLGNVLAWKSDMLRALRVKGWHLKALVFLYSFEESADCHLLSSFCDDSNLHISLFKYVLSTMGVSKESISKFLTGNRFHVKLRILSPEKCVILREIDFLSKICWSIPCLHP